MQCAAAERQDFAKGQESLKSRSMRNMAKRANLVFWQVLFGILLNTCQNLVKLLVGSSSQESLNKDAPFSQVGMGQTTDCKWLQLLHH